MRIRDPRFETTVRAVFDAPFVRALGLELAGVGPGWCESRIALEERHQQQGGTVHAGVQATMADHTAGGAAWTLIEAGQHILTVEFKINLLRAAFGETLACRAEVIKPGRTVSTVESRVSCLAGGEATLIAVALLTMAVRPSRG